MTKTTSRTDQRWGGEDGILANSLGGGAFLIEPSKQLRIFYSEIKIIA